MPWTQKNDVHTLKDGRIEVAKVHLSPVVNRWFYHVPTSDEHTVPLRNTSNEGMYFDDADDAKMACDGYVAENTE